MKGLAPVSNTVPGRLRHGDTDANGYPDLVLTLSLQGGGSSTLVLKNQECGGGACSEAAANAHRRMYKQDESIYQSIEKMAGSNAVFAAFLDIDEDGKLDILL